MPRQRLRTVNVLTEDGSAIMVTPDDDLPEGVRDGDINPKAFEPWPGDEDVEHDLSGLEYDDMTAKELAGLVKDRNLEPSSQKKADLTPALEEDDASH